MMSFDSALIVALVPGLVEVAKRSGLTAIIFAAVLVALSDLSGAAGGYARPAEWLLAGVLYGLAAAGLYSQIKT